MAKINKEFSRPSMDNPALLHQFAQTLAHRYAELFPRARGFVLELKDNTMGKIHGWEITILHGFLAGAEILISPNRRVPQLIDINVSNHSRLQQALTKIAAILVLVIMAPVFIVGLLRARLLLVLIVCLPIAFVLVLILSVLVLLICRVFRPLDRHFDQTTLSRMLAIANELPLPTMLDHRSLPTPPPPAPIPAFPDRRGPLGIKH